MMTMVEGTSIELGDPIPQEVAPEIQIETPEERLVVSCELVIFICCRQLRVYDRKNVMNSKVYLFLSYDGDLLLLKPTFVTQTRIVT